MSIVRYSSMYSCAEDPLYRPVVIKDIQRFWKRILIVDDNPDLTVTFKIGIEDSNNNTDLPEHCGPLRMIRHAKCTKSYECSNIHNLRSYL